MNFLCASSRFNRTFKSFYTLHIQHGPPTDKNQLQIDFKLFLNAWFSCGVLDCTARSSSEALTSIPPTNFLIAVNNRA
jgi:hypothetical protein